MTTPAELLKKARAASAPLDVEPSGQTKLPEKPQPDAEPFTSPPPRIVLGEVRLCPRCHGLSGKRSRALGYFPDPAGGKDRDGNPRRCVKCNGFGYVPNVGV